MAVLFDASEIRLFLHISKNEKLDTELVALELAAENKLYQYIIQQGLAYATLDTTLQDSIKYWVMYEIADNLNILERYPYAKAAKKDLESQIKATIVIPTGIINKY